MSGQGDIQIIPIATGSVLKIVAGAAAIAGGAAAAATALTGVAGFLVGSVLATGLNIIGTSMLIGGVTDLLSPQNPIPDVSSVSDIDPSIRGSYSFSGIQNVSSSGVPIPIIYGLVFSGSIIISSGTDSTQVVKSIT
jgi:predicted phage tail protein